LFNTVFFSLVLFFVFNATATSYIYTLSLHDALPILLAYAAALYLRCASLKLSCTLRRSVPTPRSSLPAIASRRINSGFSSASLRSEEHTSELQSHLNLVCRLLLEKKKKNMTAF